MSKIYIPADTNSEDVLDEHAKGEVVFVIE